MTTLRKPKGIIFDLGNTVLNQDWFDPIPGTARLLEFALKPTNLSPVQIQKFADEINIVLRKLRNEQMIEFNVQTFQRLLYETLEINLKIGYPEAEREFYLASTKFSPSEGIFNVLDLLTFSNIMMGIISNWEFSSYLLIEELKKHNVERYFSFVVASSDYGFTKPSPRLFKVATNKMNLRVSDIWFVGDVLEKDVKGAIDSGLYPVWYNPNGQPNGLNYECLEIRSWHELIEKLKELT